MVTGTLPDAAFSCTTVCSTIDVLMAATLILYNACYTHKRNRHQIIIQ